MVLRPQLWVIGGPNGAGKSTIAEQFIQGKIPIINPDVVALKIDPARRNDRDVVIQAGRKALEERQRRLEEGKSFAIETTLTGRSELGFMKEARKKGYKVNLVFVQLKNANKSYERVQIRQQRGGHSVPKEDIYRRFNRTIEGLKKAIPIAHRTFVVESRLRFRPLLMVKLEENKAGITRSKNLHPKAPLWLKKHLLTLDLMVEPLGKKTSKKRGLGL